MGDVEMVALVDDQRLARLDAGADRAGPGPRLGPFRAEEQPGAAQILLVLLLAEILDRHALRVRQEQHIALPGDQLVEIVDARARDADQLLGALAVQAQLGLRQDIGLAPVGRVEPVGFEAAQPALQHLRIARAGAAAAGNRLDLADMVDIALHSASHRPASIRKD
ncbi:hypothetical protein [Mangrovicoccus ximenensis]|uniref:hypothetical protein n=1 Tax=Mangrovicoccus ximenensis TaxID=1911570 RepID=UPI002ECFCD1F